MTPEAIQIFGAREHNLRGISCSFPSRALTVVTGPPGSGKRSLVFETLAREAERRFAVLSMSADSPDPGTPPRVDFIRGLSFVRTFRARPFTRTNESFAEAVGIAGMLDRLFRDQGELCCPRCGGKIERAGWDEVKRKLEALPESAGITVTLPLPVRSVAGARAALERFLREGLVWAIVNGERTHLEELHPSLAVENGEVEVIIDATTRGTGSLDRLREAIDLAQQIGEGHAAPRISAEGESYALVPGSRCSKCSTHFPEPEQEQHGQLERSLRGYTLPQILGRTSLECIPWMNELELSRHAVELRERLNLLDRVSLSRFPLSEPLISLSPFDGLRLRLALHLSSGLTGAALLLEDPFVDLDDRGAAKLVSLLKERVSGGDTVIVVDTNSALCRAADHLVVLGPESGRKGGEVIVQGTSAAVEEAAPSVFETYDGAINAPADLSATDLPERSSKCVLEVTGVLPLLLDFYARLPEAKIRGTGAGDFLNRPKRGEKAAERTGKLFREGVEEIRYNGVSLPELLMLDIGEARELFSKLVRIGKVFDAAWHAELRYLMLGQPFDSLSYPERSRLELAIAVSRGKGKEGVSLRFATGGLRAREKKRFLEFLDKECDRNVAPTTVSL